MSVESLTDDGMVTLSHHGHWQLTVLLTCHDLFSPMSALKWHVNWKVLLKDGDPVETRPLPQCQTSNKLSSSARQLFFQYQRKIFIVTPLALSTHSGSF